MIIIFAVPYVRYCYHLRACCHASESWHPENPLRKAWMPAFAGMTARTDVAWMPAFAGMTAQERM